MKLEFYENKSNLDFTSEDEQQLLKDLSELLDVLGYLMNILSEKNIIVEKYKYPIGILINKFILNVYGIVNLVNGTLIKSEYLNFQKIIIDISSIYTLTRTAIENYLTFFYLYVQPTNNQEEYFRYQLFELAGLHSRQRFKAELDEHINIKEEERKRILELESIIYNHPLFLQRDKKIRDNIKGRKSARIVSWEKLLHEADLNMDLFKPGWYLYSEYVHSEYVSQIQLYGYLLEEHSSRESSDTVCSLLIALTSIFIVDLSKLFKDVEERYNLLDNNIKDVIVFFNAVGRK